MTMQTCGADCSSQSVWRRREEAAVGDAAEVARTLGISHVVLDFSGEFRHRVIDYFVEEYLHGRTPNPCNVCNRFVKWEALLRESAGLGAGEIATGHYAEDTSPGKTGDFRYAGRLQTRRTRPTPSMT